MIQNNIDILNRMNESVEIKQNLFKRPDVFAEHGEFLRVGEEFGIDSSVLEYQAQNGNLAELTEDVWQILENTDSTTVELGDFGQVAELSSQVDRDWKFIQNRLSSGKSVDAPIIMQYKDRYHLVSGNTRLMVAKAMGLKPLVLFFEVE